MGVGRVGRVGWVGVGGVQRGRGSGREGVGNGGSGEGREWGREGVERVGRRRKYWRFMREVTVQIGIQTPNRSISSIVT